MSFTRAADELSVTQGAVSHQVKALELELGIRLFDRERQKLSITRAGLLSGGGARCLRPHRSRHGTHPTSISGRGADGQHIAHFAAKWLVNRLGRFAETHPDINLRISATMHHVDFAREDVDLAVRHGDGNWAGHDVVRLCSEQVFAVCSPKLHQRIREPSDVLKFPLLHLDDRKDWSQWLEAAGVVDAELPHGPVLNRASMVIDAAVDGQGVALARTTLALGT